MNKLTIGQMAEINHISEQTLRYYDKIGILKPVVVDKETGYRYYSIKQSARLDIIQYMKSLGMSLNEIKEQLKNMDVKLIKNILAQKEQQIENEINMLKNQKLAIQRALINYERYELSPPDKTITLEYTERRYIYRFKIDINFYDYGIETYEELLRKLKMDLEEKGLQKTYFCNAGSTVSLENILKRQFFSNDLFVFVDSEHVSKNLITELPANTYLCIYCDKFEQEVDYANMLLDEAARKNYTITGDYICEVIIDLPDYMDNERGMFFKLQVPIKIS